MGIALLYFLADDAWKDQINNKMNEELNILDLNNTILNSISQ
jgi:hypothetical protein